MSAWATYTLSDFLMFSARTYYRLIELYNLDVWPMHLLAAAVGAALILLTHRNDERSKRAAALLLGLSWLWVAWAFHAERFATINSAAPFFAVGFALQAVLLIFARRLPVTHDRLGVGLPTVALIGYPLLAIVSGRRWQQAEVFGISPDPTVAVTLALLAVSPRAHWVLWPLPVLWSAVSGATSWALHSRDAWALPLLALLALSQRLYLRKFVIDQRNC